MNYKTQKRYLEQQAYPDVRRALIDMRDQNLIKGHFVNTGAVSQHIIDNPSKYETLAGKGRKHIHESIGTFIVEEVKGSSPYNNRAHRCGGRTYFISGGVESIV